ncbi:MAG: helix-turn-helix domain-containing protein [Patescibacteria group bacterium]|jgi:cytoskeletal protein RodZ
MKTISDILTERRTELGLSISRVNKDTKIPVQYLTDVEAGVWKNFSSTTLAQGVVKKYAGYLKCDNKKISAMLRRELIEDPTKFILESSYKEKTSIVTHQLILFIFLLIFVAYFGIQVIIFARKPPIQLRPLPAVIRSSQPFVIEGTTEKGALVYLNEERVYQNSKGVFREEMYLKKGKKVITLKVIGTNGTIESRIITVTVTE